MTNKYRYLEGDNWRKGLCKEEEPPESPLLGAGQQTDALGLGEALGKDVGARRGMAWSPRLTGLCVAQPPLAAFPPPAVILPAARLSHPAAGQTALAAAALGTALNTALCPQSAGGGRSRPVGPQGWVPRDGSTSLLGTAGRAKP